MEDEEKREMRKTPGLGRAKSLVEACSALRHSVGIPCLLPLCRCPCFESPRPASPPDRPHQERALRAEVPVQGSQKGKCSYHARNMRSRLSAGRPKSCRPGHDQHVHPIGQWQWPSSSTACHTTSSRLRTTQRSRKAQSNLSLSSSQINSCRAFLRTPRA